MALRWSIVVSCFLLASANLRGKCVPAETSCDPRADQCCQGPGLMTCRLRSNGPDDTGVAYKCGAEFPDQMVQEKCIPEGEVCGDKAPCCQLDAKMPMSCKPKTKTGGKPGLVCTMQKEIQVEAACKLEGESCDPLLNTCCQDTGDKALRSCQLKFSKRPGVHSPAYECAKEFR
eukprot:CAMPEP_0181454980 /NCGR_PEP_ID=MMETSP1110-20121109/30521_1 /TAXON_ID=174948 /ORGANISM="Symbiodinium sp., Strain CCMP421" /LENGTH=173 /DNA_ID=CAMNT_0023579349 /DNA_START=59 /DNA_END=580 /DNA_ORIENTATION=-